MDPLTWGFIGTVIGAIVGASASIITTLINAQNSSRNQTNLEKYRRQETFREFQRDNYLKIQETFHKALRLACLLHLEDVKNFHKNGVWQTELLDSEVDTELMFSIRDLSICLERVHNDPLREEFKYLRNKIRSLSRTLSKVESDLIMSDLINKDFDKIMANLGIELRKNY